MLPNYLRNEPVQEAQLTNINCINRQLKENILVELPHI